MKRLLCLAVSLLLVGCSSVPPAVYSSPAGDVALSRVIVDVDRYAGNTVRWGGKIIMVSNEESHSDLQIVQLPLNTFGHPIATEPSQGRFIARSPDFLDPEIYREGLMVTFIGRISGSQTLQVDRRTLVLPVIEISESHLWVGRYSGSEREYNPKHDAPFAGHGYYGRGFYTP